MNSFEDSCPAAARLYEKWCKTGIKKVLISQSHPRRTQSHHQPPTSLRIYENLIDLSINGVAYRGEKYEERSDDPWPQSQHNVCKVAWQQLWKSFVAILVFCELSVCVCACACLFSCEIHRN